MSCCMFWLHPDALPVFAEWPCKDCGVQETAGSPLEEAPRGSVGEIAPLTAGGLGALWGRVAERFGLLSARTASDGAAPT